MVLCEYHWNYAIENNLGLNPRLETWALDYRVGCC